MPGATPQEVLGGLIHLGCQLWQPGSYSRALLLARFFGESLHNSTRGYCHSSSLPRVPIACGSSTVRYATTPSRYMSPSCLFPGCIAVEHLPYASILRARIYCLSSTSAVYILHMTVRSHIVYLLYASIHCMGVATVYKQPLYVSRY